MDTILPKGKPLNDAELMELLKRVRRGELSPEEAERLLSDLPEFETDSSQQSKQPPAPGQRVHQSEGHTASAPLGQAKHGTLIIDTLAAHFAIDSAALGADLFQARYAHSSPSVWIDGNTVTARFNYFSLGALGKWLRQQQGDHPHAEFTLNAAIPWQLELRSHMSNLNVNLRGMQLAGLTGKGSMNNITLALDLPPGHVPIHYDALASALEINCPAQCQVRVEVQGNTNAADVAGRKFASKSVWQTPHFDRAPNRYSIVLAGEASSLSVTYE
jgi:hypothetical protein